jgi:hypothetical protein
MIGYDVNKPVKSPLHSEKITVRKYECGFFNITQNKIKNFGKKQLYNFFNNMVFIQKNP